MITQPNVKINLGLNILRKRPDGYHDLETVFVPCYDIYDRLEIIKGDDWSETSAALFAKYREDQIAQAISPDGKVMITIAREEGVDWEPLSDLTARACLLLAQDHVLPPLKIFLEKRSPVGAGLGGGSSDAAFALKMINELCGLGLQECRIAEYAATLGSDCAFFVYDRPMFGQGRGEILEDFPLDMRGYELKVVIPDGVSVSTAEAYRGIVPATPDVPLKDVLAHPVTEWRGLLANDFESTVFDKHPILSHIKDSLYESGAVYASMSGSGSALFGIYKK